MRDPSKVRAGARVTASSGPGPARALALGLLLTLALHLVGAALPGAWAWGFDLGRFLPPAAAIVLLILALAGVALAFAPARSRTGSLRIPLPLLALVLAAGTSALCWALPDRLQFTGDFTYRQGAVVGQVDASRVLPQALPLDVWLHLKLPAALPGDSLRSGPQANRAGRTIGAVDAALWGLAAGALPWGLGVSGLAALAVSAIGLFGGALTLFTGYGKAFAEMAVVTLAAGACAARVARDGRGLLPLAALTALALTLHRSGLTLLPLWATACVVAARGDARVKPVRGVQLWLAIALPLVTLAIALPAIVAAIRVLDARHLAPPEMHREGFVGATFSLSHLRDVFNVVAWAAPLAWIAPLLAAGGARLREEVAPLRRKRDGALLAALVLPALALLALVHPIQGTFRDVDVFVPSATALAVAAAWLAADALRDPRRSGLALGTACVAAALGLAPIVHLAHRETGTARIESWLAGPPAPDPSLAARTWSFLAMRAMGDGRWGDAAAACERATTLAPNPRFYTEWGMAATMLGDHAHAQQLYAHSVALNPDLELGWLGLATSSTWLNDLPELRRATDALRRLDPQNPQLPELEAFLRRATPAAP